MTSPDRYSFPLDGRELSIGRDAACGINLVGVGISRIHATIALCRPGPVITDRGSSFGLRVNGKAVRSAVLIDGDRLTIGVVEFAVFLSSEALLLSKVHAGEPAQEPDRRAEPSTITIGRDTTNTIHINHPLVSRFHARISRDDRDGYTIVDHSSTNGTYVNGRPVRQARLTEGAIVQIGPYRFSLLDGALTKTDDANRVSLEALDISVRAGKHALLDGVSLSISPGQFAALLGPSGAGKTTLASALSGRIPVDAGAIFYNGLPLRDYFSAFSARIGFVAQENLLHDELTVMETFSEQSVLRLPRDSIPAERRERIHEVMTMLDLVPAAGRLVRDLSGGEAKRVHFGIELLSSPTLIFLDEPLAGLDTGLIRKFMELFRAICDRGHTLILTTHTLEQINLCDRVLFMNQGRIVYDGAPRETSAAFGAQSLAEVYESVKRGGEPLVPIRRMATDGGTPELPSASRGGPRLHRARSVSVARQLGVLVPRYVKIFARDWRNLTLVGAQAPLIAVLIALVFKHDAAFLPLSFYFCVCVSAIWFGGMNSVREIAREWPCFDREYRIGLSSFAYVTAKLFVYGAVALAQGAVFVVVLSGLFREFPVSPETLALTCSAAVSGAVLGLCVSALSGSVNRAISWLPIVFIPQVFLSGILVPFDRVPGSGRVLSHLTLARPIFSLYKRAFVLEASLWTSGEWRSLFLLCTGLIILVFAAVRWRRRLA